MFRRVSKTEVLSFPSTASLVAAVLLTLSFLLMVFRVNPVVKDLRSFLFYWFSPTYSALFSVEKNVSHIRTRLENLVRIDQESKALKEKIREVELYQFQHRETLEENSRLKRMLELKTSLPFKTVAATILSRDSANWNQTLTIDKGSSDGIISGNPVLGIVTSKEDPTQVHSGVVGRILQCGANSSQVLLLTDPLSYVASSIVRSGEQGLLQGGSSKIFLEYLDSTSDVQIGDWVVTSGIGGVFPAGLGIGKVSEINVTRSGFKKATVRPLVQFNQLKEILVVIK